MVCWTDLIKNSGLYKYQTFLSRLDIKILIDNFIACVNYGVVFTLNDLLCQITGVISIDS